MHMLQSLFHLTTGLHVSGVTITHLQEHKTTVTTASGNRYKLLLQRTILVYKFQQDAYVTEFILPDNCSTCFERHCHPSSRAQNNCNYSIW
jgi:hypothetical protein